MPEETLFASESTQSRGAIAEYLRTVASKLDAGESITLTAGEESITLDVPAQATFEVKAERETSAGGDGPGELSVEFELEWREDGTDGELSVE